MKRKLVKQGNGALTLTLPYQWLIKNDLQKGDYIDLIESGKDLIISSNIKRINKEYEMCVSKDKPFFKRYLRTCYILGYDSIMITSEGVLPITLIKEALSTLIGYEIIEQTTKRCVVSVVASPYDNNFDAVLKRLFFMIDSMMSDVLISLKSKKNNDLKEIASMESAINTFVDFCLRILNKTGYVDFHKTPYIYQILVGLEQMGDSLRDFALSVTNVRDDIITLFEELYNYYTSVRTLFYKYDMKKIKKIKDQRIMLYEQARKKVSLYPKEILELYVLLTILHQLEIALDPLNN